MRVGEAREGAPQDEGRFPSWNPPNGTFSAPSILGRPPILDSMKRTAQATWQGTLKEGKGTISLESGALKNVAYAYPNRFESMPGPNPEELIAAAHASCFSMAFSNNLANAGHKAERIETKATVTFEKETAGWTIKASALTVTAKVPGAQRRLVEEQAEAAKKGCPVSRVLNCDVSLEITVEESGQRETAATMGRR